MMGALVLRLKAARPDRRIAVLTPAHLDDVVSRLPGVDETIVNPFAHGSLKLGERAAFGRALRLRFDEAYVLPHSWKSALVPWFAGIRRRIGFVGEARWGVLTDARPLDKAALPRMVDRFALLAEPRGARLPAETPTPRLAVSPAETAQALARLALSDQRPAVALCVGAEYGPAKRWPAMHFAALARRLAEAGYAAWAIGGPSDAPVGAEAAALAGGALANLAGKTSLAEAMSLIAGAALVVSNDSGLMHVAAALGRPVVAIYGSTSPGFTPPLTSEADILRLGLDCSPCFERTCPLGHLKCLNDLTPDKVWETARARLAARA